MTDTQFLNDPLADDVVDDHDIAQADEDDDPETQTGDEVGFDLGGGA